MAASADLSDARARAARLLTAFEAAVRSGGGSEADSMRGVLDSVLRDNAILKRAVAIQNARQQEAAAAAEAQVAELRAALAAQGSQLAAAQMSAYSLSVHLREALAGQGQHTHQPRHPPDVC
jgi:phosphoenolpyruvate-protein kinase (PTS system EI component)